MMSVQSSFKFCYRSFKDTIVLIPGWGTDYRIFSTLSLNYNYLLPIRFIFFNFNEQLLSQLDKLSLKNVCIFGWSQGGFLACDFASKYPQRVKNLILLSIRQRYNPFALEEVKMELKKNKKAYLYKFYLKCFSSQDKEGSRWFRKNLLKKYLDEIETEQLISGLEYLSSVQINHQALNKVKKITMFHGKMDKIAPFEESNQIKFLLPQTEVILLSELGHILFLNQSFTEQFTKWISRQ